jgi:hypothetical protein
MPTVRLSVVNTRVSTDNPNTTSRIPLKCSPPASVGVGSRRPEAETHPGSFPAR